MSISRLAMTHFASCFMIKDLFIFDPARARELADAVGGDALSLADLNNFHPENGMILANTTSIGMQPKVDETPISKVCLHILNDELLL